MADVAVLKVKKDAIRAALATPPPADEFERGRQQGILQERALWELAASGQAIEAVQAEPNKLTDIDRKLIHSVSKFAAQAEPPKPGHLINSGDVRDSTFDTPLPVFYDRAVQAEPPKPVAWTKPDSVSAYDLACDAAQARDFPKPENPLDMPLPCDITVGGGTHRKGTTLSSLVARMKMLHMAAFGGMPNAEVQAKNLAILQGAEPVPAASEPAAEPIGMSGYACRADWKAAQAGPEPVRAEPGEEVRLLKMRLESLRNWITSLSNEAPVVRNEAAKLINETCAALSTGKEMKL